MRQNKLLRFVLFWGLLLVILVVPAGQIGAEAVQSASAIDSAGYEGAQFVHTATTANISGHWTEIDHPLTNNRPNAIVQVTQNWNPGSTSGVYNDHAIGVWYDAVSKKWAIFNQDFAAMPAGADFNVFIPDVGPASFVHAAAPGNIFSHWTEIDNPLTNNNPEAIVHVTQNWNPGNGAGVYNDHPLGVWYNDSTGKWAIFNQDFAVIPTGADFNIFVPGAESNHFVHSATAGNINGHWTKVDHPLANNNPNAILHVTHNFNPGNSSGTYNPHEFGVYYRPSDGRWAIFNQDFAAMPEGADFNIFIPYADPAAFGHQAAAGNISGHWTAIDHPLANETPNAMVHVTQNWNPGGGVGIYNDHAMGVWYAVSKQKWAVFNQDIAPMPEGAAFNILIPTVDFSTFVHRANSTNITGNWTLIDHPLINDDPDAVLHVTQNWNPSGTGIVYNNHPVGVAYNNGPGRWVVFNQDLAAMPDGASFNVLIPPQDEKTFVHAATAGNITNNWTDIDHPLINGNPAALLHVTQNWNPGDGPGVYNNHEIGVYYKPSNGRWAIFNQDKAPMAVGADFNVTITLNQEYVYLPVVMENYP